jgi:hypothetical protein
MKEFKKGYYKANTVNGVFFYDETMDEPDADVIDPHGFISSLKDLDDNEELTTFMGESDAAIFYKIESEYGIN